MSKILVLSGIIAIFTITSCTNDKAEDPNVCNYESSQLKYNGLIKNIINTNCAAQGTCHGTPQALNAGGEYTSYALIKAKVTNGSFNNRVLIRKDMPQGASLSECDFKELKAWYDAGAPE